MTEPELSEAVGAVQVAGPVHMPLSNFSVSVYCLSTGAATNGGVLIICEYWILRSCISLNKHIAYY